MGVEENLAYGIKFVFERQILGIKENGIKEEYQLADEGVIQAQLAGELFLKYPEIWALDDKDPFMQPEGGESVNDVDLMRLQILIC
ncbi:uncharacterized protein LOC112327361 isoform X4 [Populus trichocarpa]|uniref:uncharacterized protein LOC112327361 isoform X4 n=1 Tax=Populus trichocarpa TaxID=3694 RepID=UPI000D1881FC|nr:uncharacterized protein LOC112327361 isoform X4 [Populus trichocarpa]|eukprot:XP_024455946.1 uncharacterized protein LOC112327361 isoform X5 [Populus trichocarpa]